MISSTPEESAAPNAAPEMHPVTVPFATLEGGAPKAQKFRPQGNYIQVAYEKPEKSGLIILPGQAKPMDWVAVKVLAKGPKVEFCQVGDMILVSLKGIIGGSDGMVIGGQRAWFTQENLVVSVVCPE